MAFFLLECCTHNYYQTKYGQVIIKKIKDEVFNKTRLRFRHNKDMKTKDSGYSVLYYNGQIIFTYALHQAKGFKNSGEIIFIC